MMSETITKKALVILSCCLGLLPLSSCPNPASTLNNGVVVTFGDGSWKEYRFAYPAGSETSEVAVSYSANNTGSSWDVWAMSAPALPCDIVNIGIHQAYSTHADTMWIVLYQNAETYPPYAYYSGGPSDGLSDSNMTNSEKGDFRLDWSPYSPLVNEQTSTASIDEPKTILAVLLVATNN